jgi:drug/metabolite transporter (DMT)-like permease
LPDVSAGLLALLAAVLFALGSVLQQRGALAAPPALARGFLGSILSKPIWLAGAVSQGAGWVVQALALDRGELYTVQIVISLQVVLALPLGVVLTAQEVGRREWLGAASVVGGLGAFLVLSDPASGRPGAPAGTWIVATGAIAVLAGLLAIVARSAPPAQRAAFLAAAAGALFGFQAAVTKVFVDVVGDGLGAILSSWATYGLIVSAVLGFFLMQLSLQAGVLAATVASSNAATTLTSLSLGRFVFLETPSRTAGGKVASLAAIAVAFAGLIAMARGGAAARRAPA